MSQAVLVVAARRRAGNLTLLGLALLLGAVLLFSLWLGRYPRPGVMTWPELAGDELAVNTLHQAIQNAATIAAA